MYIANLFRHWTYKLFAPGALLKEKYEAFRKLLEHDQRSHELIAELQQIYYDRVRIDFTSVEGKCTELSSHISEMVDSLVTLYPTRYADLHDYFRKIDFYIKLALSPMEYSITPPFVLGFDEITPRMGTLVGGKALGLAVARNALGLPVPEGFVVTSNAFNHFMEANGLRGRVDKRLSTIDIGDTASLEEASMELMEIVQEAPLPESVEREISRAVSSPGGLDSSDVRFCVRSSAVGEDGRSSYAGQYTSVLNVPANGVLEACKRVMAGKYLARALFYRIFHGDIDREVPMAVLVLRMVDAKASGVVYTRDPSGGDADTLVIYSVWGLGKTLVDGTVTPGIVRASRRFPHSPERRGEAVQEKMAVPAPGGGTGIVPCKEPLPASFALMDEHLSTLVEWALRLETHSGLPQDIEWSLDRQGKLYIMQSRPLLVEDIARKAIVCSDPGIENPVLLSSGTRACGGMAAGVVFNAERGAGLEAVPQGAVLVARDATPDHVTVMDRVAALVTDMGSAAGHLAAVAREFEIPALVDTGSATEILHTGQVVTVNADSRTIYEGRVQGRLETAAECSRRALGPQTGPFHEKLRKALKHIAPLTLVDPKAENFAPQGCKTFHDILRFCHEKSVMEMFSLGGRGSRRAHGAKRLRSGIPIVVYLLDLGGGVQEEYAGRKEVPVDAIRCAPFRFLWKGLSHPGISWNPDVVHFDWKEFDRLSHGFVKADSIQLGSYAILSGDYLNFHIHFGYHFVIVDTLATGESESNYLMLRFAGGGGEASSRVLRVQFLGDVLSHLGFKVERLGDLLDAQLNRCNRGRLEEMLEMVGILLGCTRVLDMSLKDESQVRDMVERFLGGDYNLSPLSER